jgi:hypothetical protein
VIIPIHTLDDSYAIRLDARTRRALGGLPPALIDRCNR